MPIEDYHNFSGKLRRELDAIEENFHEDDIEHVQRFVRRKDGQVKESTLLEYLRKVRQTAQRLDQPLITLDADALDQHIFEIRRDPRYGRGEEPGVTDRTAFNVQHAVRMFCQSIADESMDWADNYELVEFEKNTVQPEQMLLPEDIAALRQVATRQRDIAIVEFLADTGARLTLTGTLRIGDVDLDSERPTYTPNPNAKGLKDADIKPYPLIDSVATLRSYLRQTHPRPDDDSAALFHTLAGEGGADDSGILSPTQLWRRVYKLGEEAELGKPTNPHNFRHSAITRMIREGYTRTQIEHRVQWTLDSDMWETYVHVTAEELNEDIFSHAGMTDADDGASAERHPCGNCGEQLAPHHDFCPRCAKPATRETREAYEEAQLSLGQGSADVSDLSRRHYRAVLMQILQDEPSRLAGHESPSSID